VADPFGDRQGAPGCLLRLLPRPPLHARGELDHPLGRVGPPVEEDVLDPLEQLRRDVLVHGELAGVDDPHVHAGADRMVEEGGVEGLAHRVVAAEGEGEVAHPAAHPDPRHLRLDAAGRLEVGEGVVVVLLHPGRHGEDVRIEDDVGGLEARFPGEQPVGAAADLHAAVGGLGLPALVEGHDDGGGPVAAHLPRLLEEVGLPLLQRDRVDDALPLRRLQPRLDHLPARGVDHQRQASDLRLGGQQVQEGPHGGDGVEHPLVHVHVEQVGAAAHLRAGDLEGGRPVGAADGVGEAPAAGHVRPLPDHDEVAVGPEHERLEPRKARPAVPGGNGARPHAVPLRPVERRADGRDVRGGRPAAASDEVDQPLAGERLQQGRRFVRGLVIAAKGVRQAGVRMAGDARVGDPRKLLQEGADLPPAERAVEPDGDRPGVADRGPESVDRLAREGAAALVDHGHAQHQRDATAELREDLLDREDRGFAVQRVEDRLDQEEVDPSFQQAPRLFRVGVAHLREGHGAEARIVHVGGEAERAVGRPEGAGHEARAVRRPARPVLRRRAGEARRLPVHLADVRLESVVGLRDRGGREAVRFDDVGARLEVRLVHGAHHVRPGQREDVVVAAELATVPGEPLPPVVGLLQPVGLEQRAGGAVEQKDARGEDLLEARESLFQPVGPAGGSIVRHRRSLPPLSRSNRRGYAIPRGRSRRRRAPAPAVRLTGRPVEGDNRRGPSRCVRSVPGSSTRPARRTTADGPAHWRRGADGRRSPAWRHRRPGRAGRGGDPALQISPAGPRPARDLLYFAPRGVV